MGFLLVETGVNLELESGVGLLVEGSGAAPSSLLESIARFITTTATASSLAGGQFTTVAADTSPEPFVVLKEKSSQSELRSSDVDVYLVTVEQRVYATDQDAAGNLGDSLSGEILANGGARFLFTGGATTAAVAVGEPVHGRDARRTWDGKPLWYQDRNWQLRVMRRKS